MKAIVCEMCDGRNLIKEAGFYVCQNCGTKYSVEEAKKLVVEISGPVQVDKTADLSNLKSLAVQSVNNKDYEKAQSYYEQILLIEPNNWEASFLSAVLNVANNPSKKSDLSIINKYAKSSLSIVRTQYNQADHIQLINFILQWINVLEVAKYNSILERFVELCNSSSNYLNLMQKCNDYANEFENLSSMLERLGLDILEVFGTGFNDYARVPISECLNLYENLGKVKTSYSSRSFSVAKLDWYNETHKKQIIARLNETNIANTSKFSSIDAVQEINYMMEYFKADQEKYAQIEKLTALCNENNIKKGNNKGPTMITIGIVIIALFLFGPGMIAIGGGVVSWQRGSYFLAIVLFLLWFIAVLVGIILIDKGRKQSREYNAKKKRETDDLQTYRQSLERLNKEVSEHYLKYPNCPLKQPDTRIAILNQIKKTIEEGKANSIKEAADIYHKGIK